MAKENPFGLSEERLAVVHRSLLPIEVEAIEAPDFMTIDGLDIWVTEAFFYRESSGVIFAAGVNISGQEKYLAPSTLAAIGWQYADMPAALYGLDHVARCPGATVIAVRHPREAVALTTILHPAAVAVAAPHPSPVWQPLAGRHVIAWGVTPAVPVKSLRTMPPDTTVANAVRLATDAAGHLSLFVRKHAT